MKWRYEYDDALAHQNYIIYITNWLTHERLKGG
jgi:hypothetical protein